MVRIPPWLTARPRQGLRDRAQGRKDTRAREQATMTPEEIDARLVKAILEAAEKRGAVTRQDLLLTNVPPASIDARFDHCMAAAKKREPRLHKMLGPSA